MIEITILYPRTDGRPFDHAYYETRHIPLTRELLGSAVQGVTVVRGVDGGRIWPAPTYASICRIRCESLAAYQAALLPNIDRLQADVSKFSDVAPVIQICEVALEVPPGGP